MNFDDMISTHMEWRAKLRSYLKKKDKSLNPAIVEKDYECILGKWIYGEGAEYKSNEHYEDLRQEHAEFHKCAASIIRQIDSGNLNEVESMIGADSKYSELSMNVVTKIRKIRKIVEG